MKTEKIKKDSFKLLGISLFAQAVTSLAGGSIFLGPFSSKEITDMSMRIIANSIQIAYISIFLQILTGIFILMLGVAMYRVSEHKYKTIAIIALSFYIFEVVLLAISQIFVFGLTEVSQLYSISGNTNLLEIGKILLSCKEFAGRIAMIPFGLGAILFYYLLMKVEVMPKWMALWGISSVFFILICVPLMAFGVTVPFVLLIPYVPFEFVVGIYILIKYRNRKNEELIEIQE